MIDIIFNFLNLIVLALFFIYIFKKYLLPGFKNDFKLDQKYIKDLNKEKNDLIKAQNNLHNQIIEQQIECEKLKSQIVKWKEYVQNEKILKNKEIEIQRKLLKKKIEIQSSLYSSKKIKKEIIPQVIQRLKEDFKDYFSKNQNVRRYIDNILSNLKNEK